MGYALVLGLAGGAVEALYLTVRQIIKHQPASWYYPEILWMAPVAAALATVILALPLGALARQIGPGLDLGRATFLFALPPLLGLAAAPGIALHPAAELIVCLGIAAALARAVSVHAAVVARLVPRLAVGGGLVVVGLVAAGLSQLPEVRERRAVRGLPAATAATPNVLLIILDTVRAANLGLYGYSRPTSPNLDRWAGAGVTFERAVSTAPWTLPAHASMFTGEYNFVVRTGFDRALDERHATLAEVLGRSGYATAGFVANFGYTTRSSGLQRGFARYEDFPVTHGMFLRSAWLPRQLARHLAALTGFPRWNVPKNAQALTDEFERWLATRPDRPFFVFLNYYDAHGPYDAPPEYRSRFGPPPEEEATSEEPHTPEELAPSINAYDGCIAYIDDQLARVRDMLRTSGLSENTLVVITSDHGEMFGEHGQTAHTSGLYMPALRVPLVMMLPGVLPAGVRIAEPVTLRDLPATILDVLGIERAAPIPGTSLVARLPSSARLASPSPLLSEIDTYDWAPAWTPIHRGDMKSLVHGRLHYIRNGDGVEELYDADVDPSESDDLSAATELRPVLLWLRARMDSIAG